MSPHGVFERRAQIRSLGSLPLYFTNQVVVESSAAIDEQLAARGVAPVDWDAVLLSHLDCDHANGLKLVADAKKNSRFEGRTALRGERNTRQPRPLQRRLVARHEKMQTFDGNGLMGPAGRSYDVFGDGMLVMVNIPGHSKGLCALRITGEDGRFVLLCADGVAAQKKSLAWIRAQSRERNCVACIANHDFDVKPGAITL